MRAYVLRLEVAVQEAARVGVAQRGEDLAEEDARPVQGKRRKRVSSSTRPAWDRACSSGVEALRGGLQRRVDPALRLHLDEVGELGAVDALHDDVGGVDHVDDVHHLD